MHKQSHISNLALEIARPIKKFKVDTFVQRATVSLGNNLATYKLQDSIEMECIVCNGIHTIESDQKQVEIGSDFTNEDLSYCWDVETQSADAAGLARESCNTQCQGLKNSRPKIEKKYYSIRFL